MSVAEVYLRDEPGAFVADEIDTAGAFVRARGRWRWRHGTASEPDYRYGPEAERTWPWRRVHEIRWPTSEQAA